ncbi:glycosyltransferase, partial [bacterium]|nr:glycosyltransferase [bacterium]
MRVPSNQEDSLLSDYMFTVIIPVFNGEKKLPLTLNSLQRQTHESYEIIVVDDASTDNTVQVASEGGAKIIRLGLNMGPATARNKGAKLAKGHYLLFTDSDV